MINLYVFSAYPLFPFTFLCSLYAMIIVKIVSGCTCHLGPEKRGDKLLEPLYEGIF